MEPEETDLQAALREFGEETGLRPGDAPCIPLGEVRQPGGVVVVGFGLEGDADPEVLVSNQFEIEWPPRSGRRQTFPEIDRFGFFRVREARQRMHPAQATFLDRLQAALQD